MNHKGPPHSSSEDDDTPGEPWCDCCTPQLSDINPARAIHDRRNPSTRYSIRQQHHPHPSHSNQKKCGNPRSTATLLALVHQLTTTYNNSDPYATIPNTIHQLQYAHYQSRGGHLPFSSHQHDFSESLLCRRSNGDLRPMAHPPDIRT